MFLYRIMIPIVRRLTSRDSNGLPPGISSFTLSPFFFLEKLKHPRRLEKNTKMMRLEGNPNIRNYCEDMGVEPKIGGENPQIIPFVHRVFHEIHHPFWGTPIFGNTYMEKLFSRCLKTI